MQVVMPSSNYPLNNTTLSALTERAIMDAIAIYLATGNKDKAYALADEFINETSLAILLFAKEHHGQYLSYDDLQTNLYYVLMTAKVFESNGDLEKAEAIRAPLFLLHRLLRPREVFLQINLNHKLHLHRTPS